MCSVETRTRAGTHFTHLLQTTSKTTPDGSPLPMPRPYIPPPEAQWLDNLAATQIIADSDVAHCWVLIRVGIQTLKVGLRNLGELIEHLRAGNGMMLDELMIEVDSTDPERALVGILDDQRSCSADKLIVELERLAARAAGSSPTSPAGKRGGEPH